MNNSLLFWAKLGDKVWPTEYHPVVCHLIDVGQVALRLWNDVFRQRIKEWVSVKPQNSTTDATDALSSSVAA